MTQQIQEKDEPESQTSKELEIMHRRQNVWTMLRMGMSQEKIAERLHVSEKTISRDYQELKSQAVEWMNTLPEGELQIHYKKSIEGVEQVIQELWKNYKNTKNEGMKLRILALIADKTKMHSEMMNGKDMRSMRYTVQSELRNRIKYPEQYEVYRKYPAQKKDNSQEQNVQ